jgi:hypothetical protein
VEFTTPVTHANQARERGERERERERERDVRNKIPYNLQTVTDALYNA